MKYTLLLLAVLLMACGGPDSQVLIKVTDPITKLGLDSVKTTIFRTWQGGGKQIVAHGMTNKEGESRLKFRSEEGYQYMAVAEKQYYQALLDSTGAGFMNQTQVQVGVPDTIELKLGLLSAPDLTTLDKLYPKLSGIDAVLRLRSNTWESAGIPRFSWEDIPALLEGSSDTTLISAFPRDPAAVIKTDTVRAGLAALWLVESIRRKAAGNGNQDLLLPPSKAPVMRVAGHNPSPINTAADVEAAAAAYRTWWEGVKEFTPREAARRNPLTKTGLEWL